MFLVVLCVLDHLHLWVIFGGLKFLFLWFLLIILGLPPVTQLSVQLETGKVIFPVYKHEELSLVQWGQENSEIIEWNQLDFSLQLSKWLRHF